MGDFFYLCVYKSMSQVIIEYIESLIDEVNLPMVITLVGDVYHIEVTKDLKHSSAMYVDMVYNPDKEVTYIKIRLKKYLRKLNFKIIVNYINYPEISMKKDIKREYGIRPNYIKLDKLKDTYYR
jgi:ribosome-binding factor A